MISTIERMIDFYFKSSDKFLLGVSAVLWGVVIFAVCSLKTNKRYILSKLFPPAFCTLLFAGIGAFLQGLGAVPEMEYAYFNVMVFLAVMGFLVLNLTGQMLIYRKIIRPALRTAVYVQYLVFVEIFLLAAMNHLELEEWMAGVSLIVFMRILPLWYEEFEKKRQKEEEESENWEGSDQPNSHLYGTRKRQLESFLSILEQQKKEPYAILISGTWGAGKSSFVKALEARLTEEGDQFIWVNAGSEKSVSTVMEEISNKILEVLQKKNIYIERGGLIEEYFGAFAGVLEEHAKLKFLDKIAKLCGMDKGASSKEYLNEKLEELKGTVYLIIDDLDRCDEEYQDKMFKVIRESTTELTKCKTIFLADQETFWPEKDGKCRSAHSIEKYISYTLDLCRENYDEILDYYGEIILDDAFLQGMNSIFLKDRSADEIRSMAYQCAKETLGRFQNECSKIEERKTQYQNEGLKERETKQDQKQIEKLKQLQSEIEKNMSNSRKVKNYLKGIKWNLANLNESVEECGREFQKEDWIEAVIEVQFIKNMLPEAFYNLKKYRDFTEIRMREKECPVSILFETGSMALNREKREHVLQEILYNIDVVEFKKMKTEKEKYLEELRENHVKMDHIKAYVNYAENYADLKRTVTICESTFSLSGSYREEYLRSILDRMGDQHGWLAADRKEFLELSKMLTDYLKRSAITNRERNLCIQEGSIISQRIIAAYSWRFHYVLSVVFSVKIVDHCWNMRHPSDIEQLYGEIEMIDREARFAGLKNTNRLEGVKNYCKSLAEELKQEKYKNSGIDFAKKFEEIFLILESCRFWKEIDKNLENVSEETLPLFKNYFSSGGAVYFDTVFYDVESLLQALEVLKQFYEMNQDAYESKFSNILAETAHRCVILYEDSGGVSWFKGKSGEVCDLLLELAETVYRLDHGEDKYDARVLDQIRLYTYKFREHLGK